MIHSLNKFRIDGPFLKIIYDKSQLSYSRVTVSKFSLYDKGQDNGVTLTIAIQHRAKSFI